RILFQSYSPEVVRADNAAAGNGEMFVYELGVGLRHVSPFYGESADGSISSDGKLVAFETNAPHVPGWDNKPGTMNSFILNLDTGAYTRLNDLVPADVTSVYGGGHPRVGNDGSSVFNSDVPDGIYRVMRSTHPVA